MVFDNFLLKAIFFFKNPYLLLKTFVLQLTNEIKQSKTKQQTRQNTRK